MAYVWSWAESCFRLTHFNSIFKFYYFFFVWSDASKQKVYRMFVLRNESIINRKNQRVMACVRQLFTASIFFALKNNSVYAINFIYVRFQQKQMPDQPYI